MATISKDYLDSLPADERDEFLSSVLAGLSMSPSDRDKIMEEKLREMYADHRGRIVICSFCRKDEPDDQEFGGGYLILLNTRHWPIIVSNFFATPRPPIINIIPQNVQVAGSLYTVPRSVSALIGSSTSFIVGNATMRHCAKALVGGWINSAHFTPLSFTSWCLICFDSSTRS